MNQIPTALIVISIIIALCATFYGIYFLINRQQRSSAIAAIKQGQGVAATWNYAPDEWKQAAEERFDIKPKRMMENGKVTFTDRYVYITNGSEDVLCELVGEQKYVKHLTEIYHYKDSPMNIIRFQVRTKRIKKDDNGNDTMEEDCAVETFCVPVPKSHEPETEKILKFYQDILDKNPDAIAAVMPFGLGLFGK
jgi:hypothetical protein